ncbi:hypothetical protein LEP1GSC103_1492 [Leptospira borgpetersenii serovar Javanica str. UI 09931]|uniref:Transposase DDE domain protein n=2 Tax=Leptospira borgpetersenii TaxID=174 RepID=A0AAV3JAB9_LEPBO|nr:hypothetical protein LEP1GSC101_2388 [Leptospira borgpetersenii str. UI 09149]EMK08846.1 hypothetical protein LEP1GSC066_4028 [Leptospira sp. serovar Kenya str. Sh9]EMN13136.1 hypothetical protein LEP1GSC055_3025 [Leptospira borgpetersenii str. Brem 307]EMN16519.1 hypothetical protein LEP1GSC056_3263 [Leptospira borgpetersenii str. Brem 328]EMN58437.1 hypothetical protein LEP1GSC090_0309 [Leptospira borgpetersenii serovar Javanica str. MK146]EPG56579.1 hypothetical protein LEP1GSC103_1492 [
MSERSSCKVLFQFWDRTLYQFTFLNRTEKIFRSIYSLFSNIEYIHVAIKSEQDPYSKE